MKTRDILLYSIFFLACIAATSQIVVYQLTGKHVFGTQKAVTSKPKSVECSNISTMPRPETDDPQLKVVAEYEQVCRSQFFDDMMLFTNMPVSDDNAVELADAMSARLKKFEAYGITPIVIVEPDSEWGLVDFHEYAKGDYDQWVKTYFRRLKENGINDKQLGMWIPFPEPQQPFWNNNGDPDDFAFSVNRYFMALRTYFPQGKTAILLDSQVGVSDSGASQLVAYTRLIESSLVDVAGLQGFPWHPADEDDERPAIISASQFAPAYILEEVARSLDTKEVLINTGSYRHRRALNGGEIAISTEERKTTLDSIAYEAELLRKANYSVTVNIFAENKLDSQERVDWSYWQPGSFSDATHAPIFTQFVQKLHDKNVNVSLFDSRK